MGKLYIFGIGGTGSRVLKALTLLLATGVKINTDEIVPVIIDPDHASADLTRCVKLMKAYSWMRNHLDTSSATQNSFFQTKINMDIVKGVMLPLNNTRDIAFKEFIGLDEMKDEKGRHNANYALASMLFSQLNLDSRMEVGFKGNPNIGSVVLNQFLNSDEFKKIVASFKEHDRIFIVSSIFGGTGASGFPLLLKNLRSVPADFSGHANVIKAPIGAITVLPYFDVETDNNSDEKKRSQIDSSTFISKTKAALSYYNDNLDELNALYYIGDQISNRYPNSEGGTTQKNDAHFIELAGALAIIDFCQTDSNKLTYNDNRVQNTIYKEFATEKDAQQLIFSDLHSTTRHIIQKPMAQFVLFGKYLNEQISHSLNQPWAKDNDIDQNFIHSDFFRTNLMTIMNGYLEWLTEMSKNSRSFSPFDISGETSNLFSFVKGLAPTKKFLNFASNYAAFDSELNKVYRGISKDKEKESLFIELFYLTTMKLVESKLRM